MAVFLFDLPSRDRPPVLILLLGFLIMVGMGYRGN
jgi:hypothetical protein